MMKIHQLPASYTTATRRELSRLYRLDEAECMQTLLAAAALSPSEIEAIKKLATQLVSQVRAKRVAATGLDAFLTQYQLSSQEGIALMCLAEALLRIPDSETADRLIQDKLMQGDWETHLGQSHSLFVNAATWGLMLTGRIIEVNPEEESKLKSTLKGLLTRSSQPAIRTAILQGMKILGKQFVMGRDIQEALERAKKAEAVGYRHSYDMLGEAAKTTEDAQRYFEAYRRAIMAIGESHQGQDVVTAPGISVKLSALYPRYELSKHTAVLQCIVPRLLELAQLAKRYKIGLTVDAEEANRLDLSLDIIEAVYSHTDLDGYEGFGLAVQSYQKRAPAVIDWLASLVQKHGRRIMIRLIKGAYWDAEIKTTQEQGLDDYPVFTRKCNTDVSFIACARKILSYAKEFYPMFATHNAQTVATILTLAQDTPFEFQCLHGMGRPLYDEIVPKDKFALPCRIYAPVGSHEDLLAYLVRRLLENGANSSFVNRIMDESIAINDIIADPLVKANQFHSKRHPQIPKPKDLYGDKRQNSRGLDFSDPQLLAQLEAEINEVAKTAPWHAAPILGDGEISGEAKPSFAPAKQQLQIGSIIRAHASDVPRILTQASLGFQSWQMTSAQTRAKLLQKAANLLEAHTIRLMTVLTLEGGKTLPDAIAEVREAVDFCRYYAAQLLDNMATPLILPGPTGELNQLELHGRGIAVCISPWNFPLAIFIGQLSAALAAGNVVIAKPADQTTIIAYMAVQLFHQAGFARNVLQLIIGKGSQIGDPLLNDDRVKAVVFTGSTETAQRMNQLLANRPGPITPLIAETGGQNAMIVDSSALPEQVVTDVITSAFGSAGQRCSALRVLFLQDDIADKVLLMLRGAMEELIIAEPWNIQADVGPIIDAAARTTLQAHYEKLSSIGKLVAQVPLSENLAVLGNYFAPVAYEIEHLEQLEREVFGPILHIIRFKADGIDDIIRQINATGYGLTLGIHSRINSTVQYIQQRLHAGNCYVNRSMIGAVVGVQPFGGEGLSGTGPKAGGPYYLPRLCVERTLTINTAATGGNTQLISLSQEVDTEIV